MNSFINVVLDLVKDDPTLAYAILDVMLKENEKEDDK